MSTTSLRLSEGGVDPHWAQFIDFEADLSPPLTQRKTFNQTTRANSDSEPSSHGPESDSQSSIHRTFSHGPTSLDSSPKENKDLNVQRTWHGGDRRHVHVPKRDHGKKGSTLRSYRSKSNSSTLLPRTEALLMAIADSSITARSNAQTISPKKTKSVTFEEQPHEKVQKARRTKSLGTLIGKLRRR